MVVAIIGILAAVGVVAYQGYTASASVAAAKANHANLVNWLAAEMTKCDIGVNLRWRDGGSTKSYRTFDCGRLTGNQLISYLGQHMIIEEWRNPYPNNANCPFPCPMAWLHCRFPTDWERGRIHLCAQRQRVGNRNTVFIIVRSLFGNGSANRKEDQIECSRCR